MTPDGTAAERGNQSQETEDFSWRRVAGLFSEHRRRVAFVVGIVLVVSTLGIVNPLVMRVVFDDGLFPNSGGVDLRLVATLCAVMLAVTVATGALGVFQTITTNRLGQVVLRDLRDQLYRHLQHLSVGFYSGTPCSRGSPATSAVSRPRSPPRRRTSSPTRSRSPAPSSRWRFCRYP